MDMLYWPQSKQELNKSTVHKTSVNQKKYKKFPRRETIFHLAMDVGSCV